MAGRLTADGYDEMFQVQNIAPALLTHVLLPALVQGSGRVINVASSAAFDTIPLKHLAADMLTYARGHPDLSSLEGYGVSKLLVIYYTAELSKRANSIAPIAVNPGYFRDAPFSIVDKLACDTVARFRPCPQLPDQGAAVVAFAALVPGAEAAAGSLLDFRTSLGALGTWSQDGENCVPRPLPTWDAVESGKWYDLVQSIILGVMAMPLGSSSCPGDCSIGCGAGCTCHGCQPFYCIGPNSPELEDIQAERELRDLGHRLT